jgi:hypothetical protein
MDTAESQRFEAFVRARWKSVGKGGIRGLSRQMNATPETIYAWFRRENEPQLGSLAQLAEALQTSRAEIVAAMDGYDLTAARRDAIAEEVQAAVGPLRELLRAAGLLPGATAPGGAPPARPTSRGRAA